MRPLRFILLLAFFVALPVFLTCWSLFSAQDSPADSFHAGYNTRSSRLRALFSFSTPSSLFPPSAVISLTNDNSTFFLARPAAFGPSLPTRGLSGQLWVGKGFGDEALVQDDGLHIAGWELGCSDVPGWREDERKRVEKAPQIAAANNPQKRALDTTTLPGENLSEQSKDTAADGNRDDGTDDHLHHPLPDSNPATPGKPGEPANVDLSDKAKKPTHADIESLQESADIAGKIVMLARGGCGFLEKVKWAQRRGGIALIVGDNEKGGQLTIMYAKGDISNVTIPALFTSYNAAHLLSSLVPSSRDILEDAANNSKSKSGKDVPDSTRNEESRVQDSKPVFTTEATAQRNPNIVSEGKSVPDSSRQGKGWMRNALQAIGLTDNSALSHSEDSRRPPSSGNIDWVLLEDWDEDDRIKEGDKPNGPKVKVSTTSTSSVKAQSTNARRPPGDDFVIGVQDWRDTDLVAPKPAASSKPGASSKSSSEKKADSEILDDVHQPAEPMLKGGSITPGSGEYDSLKIDSPHAPKSRPSKPQQGGMAGHEDENNAGWFSFFKSSEHHSHQAGPVKGTSPRTGAAFHKSSEQEKNGQQDKEGLWVTLTPTSVSTSPFFDTLLVLVVSPLVTLTVVYALLLLRSRIRRRRWRAPKSVVERLPVRTYHTMSTTSSTTSSQVASPDHSSATSPLLHPSPADISRRTRPRSQTTTGVFAGTSVDSSHGTPLPSRSPPSEKPKTRTPKKRYTGRQIECVVCLEEYVDGESRVMSLPCGHEFHADCITPWLVNRRRTCPICKGDVVRSLAKANCGVRGVDQRQQGEQTSDDVQNRVANTTNDEPSAAIPIPDHDQDESEDDDIERGQDIDEPLMGGQPAEQPAGWRNVIARSLSRLSGDTVWRQTPVDRTR